MIGLDGIGGVGEERLVGWAFHGLFFALFCFTSLADVA